MSETLRVTIGKKLDAAEEEDLVGLCKVAARTALPPSTADHLRLVVRNERAATSTEAFLGPSALEALLGISKKRAEAAELVATLVECAAFFSRDVGVLFAPEGATPPATRTEVTPAALREGKRWKAPVFYRVAFDFTTFHFARVEAKLLQAKDMGGGNVATGYFREMWVRAASLARAKDYATWSVAKDGGRVVDLGPLAVVDDVPLEDGEASLAGRVFFGG